jgi:hypothetical protein
MRPGNSCVTLSAISDWRLRQRVCGVSLRINIVEQHANLLGRKGFAARGNTDALKANDAAQAGQAVRYPVVRLGHPDASIFDLN